MKTCLSYQVVIASPVDRAEERLVARDAILDWNSSHKNQDVRLDPLLWEYDATSEISNLRTQDVINRQLIDDCDILVAILGNRVGSPTGGHEGGTIEEIHRAMGLGKRVLLYIWIGDGTGPPGGEEKRKLEEVVVKLRKYGLSTNYRDAAEFRRRFGRDLAAVASDLASYPQAINAYLNKFPDFASRSEIRQQAIRASRESHFFLVKSILESLDSKDIVQATDSLDLGSGLSTYWLREGLEYLHLNYSAVGRGVDYVRFFVVARSDWDDAIRVKFIRRVCGLHEMAGVQARLTLYEDLPESCLYEFAVFGERFLDLAVFDFRSERILESTISWADHRIAAFKEKIRLLEARVIERGFGKRRAKTFSRLREEASGILDEFGQWIDGWWI